jgi:hypothetical protein
MEELPPKTDTMETRSEPEVDEELLDLAEDHTPSILRPLLMVGVMVMAFWVVQDWRVELEYFFSDPEPIALGDVAEFAEGADSQVSIPHNRLVSLEGIPTQRSISARYRYSRLVGAWIFVEEKLDDETIRRMELGESEKSEVDRTYFKGVGRITAFGQVPGRYNGLREYYRTRYGIEFCETLSPEARRALDARRRDIIIEEWRREYQEASAETRIAQKLTPEPAEAEIAEILNNNPICREVYLVQAGVEPRDHIWYVVASALFVLFALFNLVLLIRWIRAFLR